MYHLMNGIDPIFHWRMMLQESHSDIAKCSKNPQKSIIWEVALFASKTKIKSTLFSIFFDENFSKKIDFSLWGIIEIVQPLSHTLLLHYFYIF